MVLPRFLTERLMAGRIETLLNIVYSLASLTVGFLLSPEIIAGITLWSLAKNTITLFKLSFEAFTSMQIFALRSFNSIFKGSEHVKAISPQADLKTKYEEIIIRLRLIENPAALKKADLLESRWNKINKDIQEEIEVGRIPQEQFETELSRRLNLPYDISHLEKVASRSFYDIAATRRGYINEFDPTKEAKSSQWGFFKTRTTTMEILSPPQESEAPALGCAA